MFCFARVMSICENDLGISGCSGFGQSTCAESGSGAPARINDTHDSGLVY